MVASGGAIRLSDPPGHTQGKPADHSPKSPHPPGGVPLHRMQARSFSNPQGALSARPAEVQRTCFLEGDFPTLVQIRRQCCASMLPNLGANQVPTLCAHGSYQRPWSLRQPQRASTTGTLRVVNYVRFAHGGFHEYPTTGNAMPPDPRQPCARPCTQMNAHPHSSPRATQTPHIVPAVAEQQLDGPRGVRHSGSVLCARVGPRRHAEATLQPRRSIQHSTIGGLMGRKSHTAPCDIRPMRPGSGMRRPLCGRSRRGYPHGKGRSGCEDLL